MKAIVKKYFQEIADNMEFPTLFYIYRTGKIIASNQLAIEIIGKETTNFNKLWLENQKIKLEEEVLDSGSCILYNKKKWNYQQGVMELDMELNVITLDEQSIVVCFLDYSYKQSFTRHSKSQIPRLICKERKKKYASANQMFGEDVKMAAGNRIHFIARDIFDEHTSTKIKEDEAKVLSTKTPLYHVIQLLRQENSLGYMVRIHIIPLINKNGTAVGVLSAYHFLFTGKEYKYFYDVTLRENNILSQVISRSETVIVTWSKDTTCRVEYVSSNISRFGIVTQDMYDGKVSISDLLEEPYDEKIRNKINSLTTGECDYFECEIPLNYRRKKAIWVKVQVVVIHRLNHQLYFECLLQDISEKKSLEQQLIVSKETLRAYKKYENLYNIQPIEYHNASHLVTATLSFDEKGAFLRSAVNQKSKEFQIFFQPVVEARKSKVVGVEALLRWRSPEMGLVAPKEFMSLTQHMGITLELENYAIGKALKEYQKLMKKGTVVPKLHLNLSLIQLVQQDIIKILMEQVQIHHIEPSSIVIEMKESLAVEDIQLMKSLIERLHQQGFQVALDNFGAGFISVNHILGVKFDYIKLDKQFSNQYYTKEFNPALIQAMLDMIRSINAEIIVEGIETKAQLEFFKLHDIYAYQGYYIGEPERTENICEKYDTNWLWKIGGVE